MSRRNVKWLYGEIPKLVSEGIINRENADKLRDYYGESEDTAGLKTVLAIFGVLGAILIGAGIILILAKNWSDLSRAARTVLSFMPLVAGQLLVLYAFLRKRDSGAWREGTTSFLMISIGACISLIGQTYHIPGDFSGFLLSWMLLALPLIYIMDATLPALFYLVGITVWSGSVQSDRGDALLFWALLALMVPFILKKIKNNPYSNPSVFICWSLSVVLCVAIGITLEKVLPGLWIVVYSSYFVTLFLLAELRFRKAQALWQQPFKVVGTLGTLAMSYLLTYEWPWERIGFRYYRHEAGYHELAGYLDYVIAIGLVLAALYMIFIFARKRKAYPLVFASMAVLSILGYFMAQAWDTMPVVLLYNAYLLILGIYIVTRGVRAGRLGTANGGMLVLAMLAILRFFDSSMGFLERGVAFILVGAGFLVSNVMIIKRRGDKNVE